MLVICRACSQAVEFSRDGWCPQCRHRTDRPLTECDCLSCSADRLMAEVHTTVPLVAGGCGRKASELRDQAAVNLVLSVCAVLLSAAALVVTVLRVVW